MDSYMELRYALGNVQRGLSAGRQIERVNRALK